MRNDHERNLNLLRNILHACEEGVNDELCDGSDGDEPWTEADRRRSRETADWIRNTFFAAEPNRGAKLKRKRLLPSETLFSEEQLWDALGHADDDVRTSAVDLMQALADLAALRARLYGSNFLAERRDVFETSRLLDDLRSNEFELHDAAHRAFCAVTLLEARLDPLTTPISDEVRERTRELLASVHARLDEMALEQERTEASQP